jgi:energy-coupling factor transport system substrate-specific component
MAHLSTRLLLSCAAIGVATGLLFIVTGGLHVVVLTTVPWLYGALIGLYFLPGAIAQGTFRRSLVALVTILVSGLLTAVSPVQSLGWAVFAPILLIGVLQELPWAVTRYRRCTRRAAMTGAVVSGTLLGVLFAVVVHGRALTPSIWLDIAQGALTLASVLAFTALGWTVAAALHRAGVGRR